MIESQTLITELGALSYVGIWFAALLSNVVIPVPEEIVLLAFGYLAGTGHINFFILMPIVMSGLLVSDIGMYLLARKGSRLVTWFYNKFFSQRLMQKNDQWFTDHINKIIFLSRFLVQLRFIGPFLAGQKKVPFRRFVAYDLAAIIIYVPLYTLLGLFFHSRVQAIIDNVGVVRNIILVLIGLFIVFGFSRKYIRKFIFGDNSITKQKD
jgi:membrane protein DedA with SNARE-associated domain